MKKVKNFEVYFIDFKKPNSLMKGKHPAIVINDVNREGVLAIPLTSSNSKYNQSNKYSVHLNEGGYARVDKFEKLACNSNSILYKTDRIPLTQDDEKAIMAAFESYMLETIQINARKHTETTDMLKVGEHITFSENVEKFNAETQNWDNIGKRTITAKIIAEDKTNDHSFILTPIRAKGKHVNEVLDQKLISRSHNDLQLGLEKINLNKQVSFDM